MNNRDTRWTSTLASAVLLLASPLGCGDPGLDAESYDDETVAEIVQNLRQAGFPAEEIDARDDGSVWVGGDAIVSLEASREMIGIDPYDNDDDPDNLRHYRTNNLVGAAINTICVDGSALTGTLSTGLDGAVGNFNILNLGFNLRRTSGSLVGCDAEIVVNVVGGSGGLAGFPSGGLPHHTVNIGSGVAGFGTAVAQHVLTHELGHCVGLRHTDFFDRSISCGIGGNEGDAGVGAVHIPDTPTGAVHNGSVMNACFNSGSTGQWTSPDVNAMNELYGEAFFDNPALVVANCGYDAGGWRVDRHPRQMADVNGDGRDDIVGFGNAGVYVSLDTGGGYASPALWVASYGYNAGGWRVEQHPRVLADVNGDGRKDVVGFGNAGTYVSLSTGGSFAAPQLWVANYGYNAGGWRVEQHPRFLADVNADGRDDVIGFGNAGVYVSLSSGSSFAAPQLWVANYGYEAGGWQVDRHPRVMADVNGDGRADVVGFGNAGTYVSLSSGSSFGAVTQWVANYGYEAGGWRVERHPRVLADVNGDGRADVVGFGNAATYVSLSTGASFGAVQNWVSNYGYNAGGWRVEQHPRVLADVTGDGRADVVGFGNAGAYVSESTGAGFTSPQLWVANYAIQAGGWQVDRHPRLLADTDQDGRADVVGFGNGGVYVSEVVP